jgi:hypothetical protein
MKEGDVVKADSASSNAGIPKGRPCCSGYPAASAEGAEPAFKAPSYRW